MGIFILLPANSKFGLKKHFVSINSHCQRKKKVQLKFVKPYTAKIQWNNTRNEKKNRRVLIKWLELEEKRLKRCRGFITPVLHHHQFSSTLAMHLLRSCSWTPPVMCAHMPPRLVFSMSGCGVGGYNKLPLKPPSGQVDWSPPLVSVGSGERQPSEGNSLG